MSTFAWTQLEARVSALERRQINSDTRIEEVARDKTASIKQLSEDMTASFNQVSLYLKQIEENHEKRFHTIETTLDEHSKRLDRIETTLDDHTKRLGRIETAMDDHTKLLTQILARLPENR